MLTNNKLNKLNKGLVRIEKTFEETSVHNYEFIKLTNNKLNKLNKGLVRIEKTFAV